MSKPQILIISPATANANNGNWQTASRWMRYLRDRYAVSMQSSSTPIPARRVPDVVIALHALRSAAPIAAIGMKHPAVPIGLILTGTDLYRDIHVVPEARRSLLLARRLVVLQDAGLKELDARMRKKSTVIYQSARTLKPHVPQREPRHVDALMIGHLREEKDPETFMRAAALVSDPRVRLLHIGGALDGALGELAQSTQRAEPRYQWLGGMQHADTRQALKFSAMLVVPSRMEGGANVIIEAVTSGVPVLASDISGNRGMLGKDYAGYFPVGDAAALAALIDRCAGDAAFRTLLQKQCARRAPLFSPARERAAVLKFVDNLLSLRAPRP